MPARNTSTRNHEKPPEIPYFEYQIQRIPPSGLSAKIAVIHSLRRKDHPNLERTLLFGNAASLDTVNFEIQEDTFKFSTKGEDTVDAIFNNLPDATEHLFWSNTSPKVKPYSRNVNKESYL
jgi:hypothetical protein